MTEATRRPIETLGFVGLGVMGEAMCRNLARKSGLPVAAFDVRPDPLDRLAADGVTACASPAAVAAAADVVFLSLPDGPALEGVVFDASGGLLAAARAGAVVVDHTTAPVGLTRKVADALAARAVHFLDAPVARTRAAAVDGTLAIMVGGDGAVLYAIRPLLAHMGTDIRHCGPVGCGQIAKLMNNKVLAETVVALADALTIGRRAGIDGEALFGALAAGSADSFALRNHGMKALLPGEFPTQAFSTEYMLKDLGYALELAEAAGVEAPTARVAARRLREAIDAGLGDRYFPALLEVIESEGND